MQLNSVRGLQTLSGLAQLHIGPLCPCCLTPLHFRVCFSAPWELSLPVIGQPSDWTTGPGSISPQPSPECPWALPNQAYLLTSFLYQLQQSPRCPGPAQVSPSLSCFWMGCVCVQGQARASLWLQVHDPQEAASPHFSLVKSIFREQLVSG